MPFTVLQCVNKDIKKKIKIKVLQIFLNHIRMQFMIDFLQTNAIITN